MGVCGFVGLWVRRFVCGEKGEGGRGKVWEEEEDVCGWVGGGREEEVKVVCACV